ncbi:LegC family aminotransferase [Alicyclobacillus macrosporangiidus]|uniref:LegC family aminotransferase n=1 Tax=Alicyclobacillus macrosporangiidus TaxID=392015 RepID=UPI0026F17C50|nr:LegC family aminotransferase [Alicyclobacillus macrosporangiidus]
MADTVLGAIRTVIGDRCSPVALHEPMFGVEEERYILDCIRSTFVSSVGRYVDRFEQLLADYTGVKCAVAVVNGTAALHVALLLAGVEPGDEVLVPALTFVATANAVSFCGAVPHFVDCDAHTLGLDPRKLADYLAEISEVRDGLCYNRRTGRRIRAVVPMHTFGHPVDLDALVEVSGKYRLVLIEDAAESLGSFYKGKHTGGFGRLAALSFNGNKIVTTGGGGAILTNDEELGRQAKHLTTTAKVPHRWAYFHDCLGYNYRMPNLNAALGCAQLEKLPQFLEKKRMLAARYQDAFASVAGATVFREPEFARSNYWLNAILLDEDYAEHRDRLLDACHEQGIYVRPAWTLLHRLPMYIQCPKMDLSVAEDIERRLINLPSSVGLV